MIINQSLHLQKIIEKPIVRYLALTICLILIGNIGLIALNNENTDSLSYKFIVTPMQAYLTNMHHYFHIRFAISIILLTIIVKAILSPISYYGRQHPSLVIKLIITTIQLPFLSALYFLASKKEMFAHQWLGQLSLDQPSIALALLITCIYTMNNIYNYQFNQPHNFYLKSTQQRCLATFTPIMTFLIASKLIAGITLYLLISNAFSFIETIIYYKKTKETTT